MDLQRLDMTRVGARVFMAFGALIALVGLSMVYSDPAGFLVMAFGAVFVGAGWLTRRVFATPAHKKGIAVEAMRAAIARRDGTTGTRTQSAVIYVPEGADEDEARADWVNERLASRPDWVARRIVPEFERHGGMLTGAAVLWSVFALVALSVALGMGGLAWLAAAGLGAIAVGLDFKLVQAWLHRRKFTASAFAPGAIPFRLGGTLSGIVETGLPRGTTRNVRFTAKLSCVHRWEETIGSLSDPQNRRRNMRRDTLWSVETEVPARAGPGGIVLAPVRIAIPSDGQAMTLTNSDEGILWELELGAPMKGLDYGVSFTVPVL